MAKQSLFSACKRVFRDGISGTYTVGNNDIFLELYSQQDIDRNNEIGNSSEENIVVVAGDTITIPEGYTLTPVKPKKSLVVICNTFVNNGTISMYQKAPNVLPHDLFIIEKNEFDGNKDIIIPAYANNQVSRALDYNSKVNGANGTNRQCGSGGLGSAARRYWPMTSGSGYAFGGGAGTGGILGYYEGSYIIDSTYPMRGGSAEKDNGALYSGGVGNPTGLGYTDPKVPNYDQDFGCGGRIIIFCYNFTNNGNITVNGTSCKVILGKTSEDMNKGIAFGGASGGGAVDLFYTNKITEGTITATGGSGLSNSGNGGDGSITLTPWLKSSVLKPIAKYMSKENMVYFLTNYIQRLKQGED